MTDNPSTIKLFQAMRQDMGKLLDKVSETESKLEQLTEMYGQSQDTIERLTDEVQALRSQLVTRPLPDWQKPNDAVISLGLVDSEFVDNPEKIKSAANMLLRRRKAGVLKLGKHFRFAGGGNTRLQYNVPECNKVLSKAS